MVFYVNCLFPPVLTSSHIFFINNRLPLITSDMGILRMWYDILHPGCSNFHEPSFTVASVQQTIPIRRPNNSLHTYFICTNKQKAIKINWKLVKDWLLELLVGHPFCTLAYTLGYLQITIWPTCHVLWSCCQSWAISVQVCNNHFHRYA